MEIKELFNKILDSAQYPEIWNHGLIYSIYKIGDTEDPSNYRGITLTTILFINYWKNCENRYCYAFPQAIENSFKRAYVEVEDNIIIYIERLKT